MKNMVFAALAAVAVAAAAIPAVAADFGAATAPAAAKKGKPKPKSPKYTKLKSALAAAAEWEQPVVLFALREDEQSVLLKQKILNRAELKSFWNTNCVVCVFQPPADRRDRNRIDETKLDKAEAKLVEDTKNFKFPFAVVLDAKGSPVEKASEYVLDVGAGPWLSSLEAAFAKGKFKFYHTKESRKLVDEAKPDGKTRARR